MKTVGRKSRGFESYMHRQAAYDAAATARANEILFATAPALGVIGPGCEDPCCRNFAQSVSAFCDGLRAEVVALSCGGEMPTAQPVAKRREKGGKTYLTSEMLDYEKEIEAAAIREMEAKYAAMKLAYDDRDFVGETEEVITRGLRDRSPTICTRSARVNQSSGARDALPFGCRPGLLLSPPKKSRHRGAVVVV